MNDHPVEALKACPFCGGPAVKKAGWPVMCEACGITGPNCGSGSDTITAWNTRAPHPIEAQGSETGEKRAVVPREPTERDVAEILYEINRKRSSEDCLSEAQVREFVSTFLYVCARYPATDTLTRPDPSLGGENVDLHDKIEGPESDLFDAVGVAYSRGAVDWTRRNYPAWFERLKVGGGQPPPSLGMEGVREALKAIIQCDDDALSAKGKPGANLNGLGLVDLFDSVGHPFGSGPHKQQPYRSVNLEVAMEDGRKALASISTPGKASDA